MADAATPARVPASERLLAWAWQQKIPPEEKLLLLALCTGEPEPDHDEAIERSGLTTGAALTCAQRLHERGLIDDHGAPAFAESED